MCNKQSRRSFPYPYNLYSYNSEVNRNLSYISYNLSLGSTLTFKSVTISVSGWYCTLYCLKKKYLKKFNKKPEKPPSLYFEGTNELRFGFKSKIKKFILITKRDSSSVSYQLSGTGRYITANSTPLSQSCRLNTAVSTPAKSSP